MGTSAAVDTRIHYPHAVVEPSAVRVLIVCPVRLYGDEIADRLDREPGFEVVGGVTGTDAALAHLTEHGPAVVLLDAGLLRGADVVRGMIEAASGTTVLALALDEDETSVLGCAEAGIVGYIPPRASLDELVSAVRGAIHEELVCTPRIAGSLVRRLAALARERRSQTKPDTLTEREREVLALLGDDLSNKAIASRLGIAMGTVKNHVHRVLEKLGVKSRDAAAACAGKPEATGRSFPISTGRHRVPASANRPGPAVPGRDDRILPTTYSKTS